MKERILKQFRKNRLSVFSSRFILAMLIVALLADFLANEKPVVCNYKGRIYFPVFRSYLVNLQAARWQDDFQNADWKTLNYDWSVFPPIPYLPENIDKNNLHSTSPFSQQPVKAMRWRHWMGTDELGHDILSAMIHGTRIAILVGLISMVIAGFIGVLVGSLAGYFGDEKLLISKGQLFSAAVFVPLSFFYGFSTRYYVLKDSISESLTGFILQVLVSLVISAFVLFIGYRLGKTAGRISFLSKRVRIPVDLILSRLMEVLTSIPTLFLIISIVAVAKPSLFLVMAIIGLTTWTGIARFMRAELLKIRNLDYIEAAQALGYSEKRILLKHAIPNALTPVFIALAFGIASAILIESTLSFLGIGVPPETLTWGSLLSEARQTPSAWWMAVFPGFAIFITVTVYNLAGEGLSDALDPRLRKES